MLEVTKDCLTVAEVISKINEVLVQHADKLAGKNFAEDFRAVKVDGSILNQFKDVDVKHPADYTRTLARFLRIGEEGLAQHNFGDNWHDATMKILKDKLVPLRHLEYFKDLLTLCNEATYGKADGWSAATLESWVESKIEEFIRAKATLRISLKAGTIVDDTIVTPGGGQISGHGKRDQKASAAVAPIKPAVGGKDESKCKCPVHAALGMKRPAPHGSPDASEIFPRVCRENVPDVPLWSISSKGFFLLRKSAGLLEILD